MKLFAGVKFRQQSVGYLRQPAVIYCSVLKANCIVVFQRRFLNTILQMRDQEEARLMPASDAFIATYLHIVDKMYATVLEP